MEINILKSKLLVMFPIAIFILSACNSKPTDFPVETQIATPVQSISTETATPTFTPTPPRVLTVCMGQEPASLFIYGDSSAAAQSIREAVYDGPYDILGYEFQPVILEKKPRLEDRDALLEPVQVDPGDLIVDASSNPVNLENGITYFPSGCKDATCAKTFSGDQPVTMDQLVVRFKLKSGIHWSDGTPVKASDSVYSFEIAKTLYPKARPELIRHTQVYQALDESTVEWRGIPGYRDPVYYTNFFTPLPQHLWGSMSPDDLLTSEISTRRPMGWGPYIIDDWVTGDHISLSKNPDYFRANEGLPHFDHLVYRFVANADEALAALLAGECDFVDETAGLDFQSSNLIQLQDSGRLALSYESGTAWEHADFGIDTLNPDSLGLFKTKEVRQAIAMCIDRQRMVDELFSGHSQVPDTYVPPTDPLFNPDVKHYSYDPAAGSALLDSLGWKDSDQNPDTPRIAQGVIDVPDGTPFEFDYLTLQGGEGGKAAQILQSSLANCGVKVNVIPEAGDTLFAPGPQGPIFGRNFFMTQFAWSDSLGPPCFLYTSSEIPGSYPEFPKGWGGANDTGYSNPQYDQACEQALSSLPDDPEYTDANRQAQAIFADDLPSIPLYLHVNMVAMRPDMCEVTLDPSATSDLWNLENFNYGEECQP
jgi:peptide/nickel transport system substrate-binding protein